MRRRKNYDKILNRLDELKYDLLQGTLAEEYDVDLKVEKKWGSYVLSMRDFLVGGEEDNEYNLSKMLSILQRELDPHVELRLQVGANSDGYNEWVDVYFIVDIP